MHVHFHGFPLHSGLNCAHAFTDALSCLLSDCIGTILLGKFRESAVIDIEETIEFLHFSGSGANMQRILTHSL